MTELRFLEEIIDPTIDDWVLLQRADSSAISGKAKAGNLPGASVDTSNLVDTATFTQTVSVLQQTDNSLQSQINNKANSSDVSNSLASKVDSSTFTNTVSVLETAIGNKSSVGHTHSISDVNGLLEKLSFQWTRKNAGELIYKTLVDTSAGDGLLSVPASVVPNTEFEIKKIFKQNYCRISGIDKINGYTLAPGDSLFFDDSASQASTTKLIYIDSNVGWLSFPSTAFSLIKPLSLPTNKLKQLFYAGNINLPNNSQINIWNDPTSSLHATQSNAANRATLKHGCFGNNTVPGVVIEHGKFFNNVDFSWIVNKRFSICVVEKRTSQGSRGLIGGSGVGGLSFVIDNVANIYYFTKFPADRIGVNVGAYQNLLSRIWMLVCNDNEWALWLNGTKISSRISQYITSFSAGTIGLIDAEGYVGEIGLIAFYEGHCTDSEIKSISDIANQTFKIY